MKEHNLLSGVLCLFLTLPCFAFEARRIDGNEWQDLTRMSLGREKTRAAFAPFATERAALAVLPWKSDRQLCLDSETAWKFRWSKDPASRPVGFERPDYDVSSWETIKVPCSWQAYDANGRGGWGTALYTNVIYPFAVNPPRVMDEPPRHFTNFDARNPVGSYRRDFEVPADWTGDRVFLKLDGVDSFYYLWVNGTYVGFTKDSRCAAEYDITDCLRKGRNTLALEVYRYSDGSYFEDQDMFRLSGIFRSTWLVRRPDVRIRDFFVKTRPSVAGDYAGDWTLEVEVEGSEVKVKGEGERRTFSLFTFENKKVEIIPLSNSNSKLQLFSVARPKLWSPESPNCYKLVIGNGREYVSTLVGFRTSEIRNGRYELNGRKVKLHGADRHETDPRFGHYCPRERQEEDVRLLKRANCNLVRNSHYPQDDYWYYLCDVNGICLMDEANVETHGYHRNGNSGGSEPLFRDAMVWRNLNMVERNKNHPSVLFWSHGNECGRGDNFKAADEAVHARDRSRPTHYEGDWSASDIDSNMYPGVGTVWGRARDTNAKRPYFLCEYAHNMMNAMGNLKDYQDAIESSDVVIGGCIWDWVDQGLYKKVKGKGEGEERMIIAYGGDFGDQPNDGQFVMNGCILSDRSLEPGYWEIKHVFQPVCVTANDDGRSVTVKNRQFFRGLDVYDATWKVLVNGRTTASGRLDLEGVGPRGERTLALPEEATAANVPGKSVSVRYSFAVRSEDGFLEKGYVIADDQIDLPNAKRAAPLKASGRSARCREEGDRRVFVAGDVSLAFDRTTGALVSYAVKGEERLLKPMTLDAYRAPSSNEVGPAQQWSACGWRTFRQSVRDFGKVVKEGDALAFTLETEYRGAAREELHDFGRQNGRLERKGEISALMAPVFSAVQHWRVYGDGTVTCQSEIRPHGLRRELPRIGYRFAFPLDFAKVGWFGRGPFENYRDRKSGAFRGLWKTDLRNFVMPYARPEDANNFEETDAVTLYGAKGQMGFATLGAPFAFAAIPYDPGEIVAAAHPAELPKPSKVEFGIFAETRGLGGASCGPGPHKEDIIDTARNYRLEFALSPQAMLTARTVPPFAYPPAPENTAGLFGKYSLHSVTSEQGGPERGEKAFDGDTTTFWHTKYGQGETDYPHAIVCDYGETKTVRGLLVVPRQDMPNGRVKDYVIETSTDAQQWTRVAEGLLPNTDDPSEITFASPVTVRYLRFTAKSPQRRGEKWASMAEIQPVFVR